MSAGARFGATALRRDDLVRFNRWLWVTRLQSLAAILSLTALVAWIDPDALGLPGIALVCVVDLLLSGPYEMWLRRGRRLRLLAYAQLTADTLAMIVGLYFVYRSPLLFHFVFLLVVVPASMIEWQCGVFITLLATTGHLLLLEHRGSSDWLSVASIVPPTIFLMTTLQALFYARHLAAKNLELAAAAGSLDASNRQLEDEAAVSTALLRVAQALGTSLDPHEILAKLTDAVREALACDVSAALLRVEDRDAYRVVAASGAEPEIVDELRAIEFPIDSVPLLTAAVQHGIAGVDSRESTLFPGFLMARWHMRALFCVDLQRAGTSVGLLAVGFNEHAGPFAPREQRLLRSIAQQAAMALENARLVDSLRAASRLKSEFIGTMSHELRSPLNVVIGYVDLLLDGEMGPVSAEQNETLARVRQHALQLLELIKETLDVNRLEAGRLPLDIEAFTVGAFIDELKGSVPAEWLKPGVALRWQVEVPALAMRSDRGKLKKVVRNLIHNALKFTDHGAVVASIASADGWVDLTVSDTGIGIAADEIPIIFEMFRQVDGSMTRRHGGVGLGLYIVKQLVRALGGDISVTSSPGSGSTFHVRIRSSGPPLSATGDAPLLGPQAPRVA